MFASSSASATTASRSIRAITSVSMDMAFCAPAPPSRCSSVVDREIEAANIAAAEQPDLVERVVENDVLGSRPALDREHDDLAKARRAVLREHRPGKSQRRHS